jgi:hypothetical protein
VVFGGVREATRWRKAPVTGRLEEDLELLAPDAAPNGACRLWGDTEVVPMPHNVIVPTRESDADSHRIRHYAFRRDHRGLLPRQPSLAPRVGSDDDQVAAVIVLNHLHPGRVGAAVDLAADLDCALIVICTRGYEQRVVQAVRARPRQPPDAHVLALDWPARMPLDQLATVDEFGARGPKHRDVAAKRNIGLALARQQHWERVLVIDDDVRRLAATQVRSTAQAFAASSEHMATGWLLGRFPDNSVICHARRLAGLPQGIFLGGGALVVRTTEQLPMFPPVYNEDWLFLFDLLMNDSVSCAGTVGQLQFNPFGFPERAQEEEFGDLLAEGVFQFLHEPAQDLALAMGESFWREVVDVRRREIKRTLVLLNARSGPRQTATPVQRRLIAQACRSLAAAANEHLVHDLAPYLASYVRAWRSDVQVWNDWFDKLELVEDLVQALDRLGITHERLIKV